MTTKTSLFSPLREYVASGTHQKQRRPT